MILKKNNAFDDTNCQLILCFGNREMVSDSLIYNELRLRFPIAVILMCSTAGEIIDTSVHDNSVVVNAIYFEKTDIEAVQVNIENFISSFEAGKQLAERIERKGLKHVFLISDGSKVNGSDLVAGLKEVLHDEVSVTGGLAGDGSAFQSTVVGLNEVPKAGNIAAVAFYGDSIRIGHGIAGGWEMFGLERKITKSIKNELFEIDNVNALALYKKYLGKYSSELPASALLFPLSIKLPLSEEAIVRTILSVNETDESMVFAGNMPIGASIRFMKANFDKLIDAASDAATNATKEFEIQAPKFALIVSCIGRKIILSNRIEEELEAVKEVLGKQAVISGFYSYGEIAPINKSLDCELHNQTITITTFDEI